MRHFHHILYASTHLDDATLDGLKQALSMARENQAALKFLLLHPELPSNQWEYRDMYHNFFHTQVQELLETARAALSASIAEIPAVQVELEALSDPPAISMIRHVLRDGHDLLIKEAEVKGNHKGFKALDMTLLRKCPCPVWLARPISASRADMRVAVAINPESRDDQEQALSLRLLELASSLAAATSGELAVVSCWDYPFEDFLRHNGRAEVAEATILQTVLDAESEHRAALQHLLQQAGLTPERYRVYHLRGQADDLIPDFVEAHQVDVLVMGSLARTGIKGFLIGNTAENIAEELGGSLVALKPHGFVSPIEPY